MKIKPLEICYDRIILKQQELVINDGQLNVIIGMSGSGKSSLLSYIYGELESQYPTIEYGGKEFDLSHKEHRYTIRKELITYLKQEGNFLDDLNCIDNLKMIGRIVGNTMSTLQIKDIFKSVGLNISGNEYPNQLSGGERCKLSLAIALVRDTPIIMCDEITASLDKSSVNEVIKILKELTTKYKKTVICATHSMNLIECGDVVFKIDHCKLEKTLTNVNNLEFEVLNNRKQKSFFPYLKYISHRLNKNPLRNLGYIVLLSLVSSIICIGMQYGTQYQRVIQILRDYAVPNQYFLTNVKGGTKDDLGVYRETNYGFDEIQKQKIQEVFNDCAYYPFFTFSVYPIYGNDDGTYFEIYKNNERKFEDNINNVKVETQGVSVLPYFKEQNLDELSIHVNPQVDGVYISQMLANMYNIKNVNDLKIKVSMNVPIYSTIANKGIENASQFINNIYQNVEVELPVRGILDEHVIHATGVNVVYMNYDLMKSILDNNLTQDLPADAIPYEFSTYIIFIDEEDAIATTQKIESMDKFFSFKPLTKYLDIFNVEKVPVEKLIRNFVLFVFGLITCLSIGYGVFNQKQEVLGYKTLYFYGLRKKENYFLLLIHTLVFFFFISTISISLSLIIAKILVNKGQLLIIYTSFSFFIRCSFIGIVLIVSTLFPTFLKMRKFD